MCVAVELQDVAAQSERGREGHDSARVDRPWHYHYHYHRSGFHRLELDAVNLSSAFSIAAVEFDARRPKLLTIVPVDPTIARSHARSYDHVARFKDYAGYDDRADGRPGLLCALGAGNRSRGKSAIAGLEESSILSILSTKPSHPRIPISSLTFPPEHARRRGPRHGAAARQARAQSRL